MCPSKRLAASVPHEHDQQTPSTRQEVPSSILGVRAEYLDFRDRSHGQIALDDVSHAIEGNVFVWIDVDAVQADPRVLQGLVPSEALAEFDPAVLTEEGCCDAPVSELRRSDKGLQICLVGLIEDADGFLGQRLQLLVGGGFLVTVHRGDSAVLQEVRRAYLADFRMHATSASFLIYEIFNEQVDQYLRLQNRLEANVEVMRKKLLKHSDEATLLELADASNQLLTLRKHAMPTRRVLEELVARKSLFISDATLGFLSGMVATLERLLSDITSNLGILESSMNLSLTMVTLRTNVVMNRLVVVSTVFLPLTFLCGVYGMNFETIPELNWVHGYKFFWGLSTTIVVTLVVLLRKAKLL